MLGDAPALAASRKVYYLRMLADDPDDATDDAEDFLRNNALSVYYDEVAGRALMLAQADVNRGVLDPLRQARIRDAIKGLIEDLADRKDHDAASALGELPADWRHAPVLCVRRPRPAWMRRQCCFGRYAGQARHWRARGVSGPDHGGAD